MFFVAYDAAGEGLGELGAIPVTASFGRSVHPNLADPAIAQSVPRFGIDDADHVRRKGLAAAHHWGLVAVLGQGLFDPGEILLGLFEAKLG